MTVQIGVAYFRLSRFGRINEMSFICTGLTNTVTAVKNAQMAESPVLLIGGAAATLLKVCRILQMSLLNDLVIHENCGL